MRSLFICLIAVNAITLLSLTLLYPLEITYTKEVMYNALGERVERPITAKLTLKGDSLYFDNAVYFVIETTYLPDGDARVECQGRDMAVEGTTVIFHIWRSEKCLMVLRQGAYWSYYQE